MRDELRRSAAHVFVDDLGDPALRPDDAHHLLRVLRLRDGEVVTVTDGRGGWRVCRVAAGGLSLDGEVVVEDAPAVEVTVGFAPPKGDRPELVVQKLTEVGVDRIVVVEATRSVVRWDEARAAKSMERLRRVAREAAMQSRRVWLPDVAGPAPLADVVRACGAALAEPGGETPSLERPAIVVGPEGGWAPEELEHAPSTVDLGPTVLRAETAAIAAGVLLTALRSEAVRGL